MAKDTSFKKFLIQRNAASAAWVSGDFKPLSGLLAKKGDATFFGPMGGSLSGAKKIAACYESDATRFSAGSTNRIEVLHTGSDGDLGYAVFHQVAKAKPAGESKKVPMALRVTEIFRRYDGGWKLIHRHADMLVKPQSPK
jgi:ketosteroid isomerase-like protein